MKRQQSLTSFFRKKPALSPAEENIEPESEKSIEQQENIEGEGIPVQVEEEEESSPSGSGVLDLFGRG